MFVEKVKSEGLSHLSYVIGSGGEAAVVDPRRDFEAYMEISAARSCRITHIFETHRNEDLLSGAAALAERTGASVFHGPNAAGEVAYAETTREGSRFRIGRAAIDVLETPGHTDDSLSYVLVDTDSGDEAIGVFTGDALFVGEVGRTDFYPDRAREVAGLLYDSLGKLTALGDHVLIYPAHGAGSVCGSGMADREFSTIGYERKHNSALLIDDREKFIDRKVNEHHRQPPYFRTMEALNLTGASAVPQPLGPPPLSAAEFDALDDDVVVLDVRSASAYLGAHVPDSIALPQSMISAFAGWLIEADDRLALVAEDAIQAEKATRYLLRIGFDHVLGYLTPSLAGWAAGGKKFGTLPVVEAETVKDRLSAGGDDWILLDVRGADEIRTQRIAESAHVYVGDLPRDLASLERNRSYTVMCGSGTRATIAASLLRRAGFDDVDLFLGSLGAWASKGFETVKREAF